MARPAGPPRAARRESQEFSVFLGCRATSRQGLPPLADGGEVLRLDHAATDEQQEQCRRHPGDEDDAPAVYSEQAVDIEASLDLEKAAEFNRIERVRDPSHTRALPLAEPGAPMRVMASAWLPQLGYICALDQRENALDVVTGNDSNVEEKTKCASGALKDFRRTISGGANS